MDFGETPQRKGEIDLSQTPRDLPLGVGIIVTALLAGVLAGTIAQLLRQEVGPLAVLGGGTAAWLTIGLLLARPAARARPVLDGTVWAASVAAAYLVAWLLAYCTVFAMRESGGFSAAWLHERLFMAAVTPTSVALGLVAALSLRRGRLGDACLAMPLAWSLPEVVRSLDQGWVYVSLVGLPTLALAVSAVLLARRRHLHVVAFVGALALGGAGMYVVLTAAGRLW